MRSRGRKQKDWRKIIITGFVVLVLVLAGSVFMVRRVYNQNLRPVGASKRSVLFTVPKGASAQEVSASLKAAGLIRTSWAFEWYFRTNNLGQYLQAGTYTLRPSLSVSEIADVITQGRVATDLVTIVPGQRLDQIRTALITKYGFSAASVDEALKPGNYAAHPALVDKPKDASLEGYLYPESFQKTADTSPQTIIGSSLDQMQKFLTPELRAGIVRQGLTVHQGVILASIIEQEVSDSADKKTVAQVFLRRLREDRLLQSDATASYGAVLSGQIQSLSRDQILVYDSLYNTYLHPGLTPGPISNVSNSSLEAVSHPSDTDYLYFVAGDDGKTYFSRTLAEHEALTAQHCKTLCQ
ncbi:MAG TPA: endolytic transglycosylase MltG [Candidatus Limnocylindria bacterium]|nr:endolytic transglycosylase MltG [Candidatus Limnocylindria bacterium]